LVGYGIEDSLQDYPSMNYYSEFTLLNLVLQTSLKVLQRWNKKIGRKGTQDKFVEERERRLIQYYEKLKIYIDEAIMKQIIVY
jgi:hypothetical protein